MVSVFSAVQHAADAGLFAGLLLIADVNLAGRIFAHQHGGQTGRYAAGFDKRGRLFGNFRANLLGQGFSVQNDSSHGM